MTPAPFHSLPGDPPVHARAFWLRAGDGVRLRAAHWPSDQGRGTVLLMQGRTEYHEKYAATASDLNRAGLDVLAVEWRGQGLSDRLDPDSRASHVPDFADYQQDVVEMIVAAQDLDLPRPWHLLAHSMGGAIGLAALTTGLPVRSAVFSAPMWGIRLGPQLERIALTMSRVARRLGRGRRYVPTSGGEASFVLTTSYAENLLTGDPRQWGRLIEEAVAWPEMVLGGVSHDWLFSALQECRRLAALPSPPVPTLIGLGGKERIVSPQAIHARLERWPQARLLELPEALHEPMMERPPLRRRFLDAAIEHYLSTG